MAITWGSTTLKVLPPYQAPTPSVNIVEVSIIAEPGSSSPSSVLQQRGRTRKRAKVNCYVTTGTAYNAFVTDWAEGTQRTYNDGDTANATYQIINVSQPLQTVPGVIEFTLELVEV